MERPMDTRPRAWRAAPLLLVAIVVAGWLFYRFAASRTEPVAAPSTTAGVSDGRVVALQVDFGDGQPRLIEDVPFRDGLTVLQAMQLAQQCHKDFTFRHEGTGESAFVSQIGPQANEGGGDEARNWLYYVDGQRATVSFGIYALTPQSTVLWKYEKYE